MPVSIHIEKRLQGHTFILKSNRPVTKQEEQDWLDEIDEILNGHN